jgi:hypothetical protein
MAGDGGFLWLVGNLLHAVDAGFDYNATAIGMQSIDDGEQRYVEQRRNQKGEPERIGIIETAYNDWREDVGQRNSADLRDLSSEHDQGAWGPGFF